MDDYSGLGKLCNNYIQILLHLNHIITAFKQVSQTQILIYAYTKASNEASESGNWGTIVYAKSTGDSSVLFVMLATC